MAETSLGAAELRFAELIWANARFLGRAGRACKRGARLEKIDDVYGSAPSV